uniref:C-type lectin domain-containing protein n=1 Tax=Magallana gigas TaxID=29159 RepID=A0A8W8K1H2_MAGGI
MSLLRTFNDSRTFCSSLSPPAYVIEVQSQAENDWLLELTATLCEAPNKYWLNGYDTDNSGTFTWINGQNQTTYTNWHTGQPDDFYGIGSEKCIVSSTGFEGVWVDIQCTESRPVVCERNV